VHSEADSLGRLFAKPGTERVVVFGIAFLLLLTGVAVARVGRPKAEAVSGL
jgi:hypothetical protein